MASPVNLGHFEKIRAIAATPRVVVIGGVRAGATSELTVLDPTGRDGGKRLRAIKLPSHALAAAICGERIVAGCADGQLRVYKVEGPGDDGKGAEKEERRIAAVPAGRGAVTALCAAPGGGKGGADAIYSAGADGAVRKWSLQTGERLGEWQLSSQPLRAVGTDGEHLVAAGDDGVLRALHLGSGARREMPGHGGPVLCLAFTPDGRVVTGGDDGTVRIWYLTGALDSEVRGGGDVGHVGPVLAVLCPKAPDKHDDGEEPIERIYSAGADGKIKVWRLEERRKPLTLTPGSKALHALALLPPASSGAARSSAGAILAGGDGRELWRGGLDAAGAPQEDKVSSYGHGLQALEASLSAARPGREAALRTLLSPELVVEPEALALALRQLGAEREAELRSLIAAELGARACKDAAARAALRERLDDDNGAVRRAALGALRAIDGEQALGPLRAALGSRYPDLRRLALRALTPLGDSSPLVPGLIADRLADGDATVRQAAVAALVALHPERSPEPLRLAYERGPADVKIEALLRGALGGLLQGPALAPLASRALDDESPELRRAALALLCLARRPLSSALLPQDEELRRTAAEIGGRAARLQRIEDGDKDRAAPTEEEGKAALARLHAEGKDGAALAPADLEPLLLAMSCRTPDTALRGARGLARLGDGRALGALLQLSRESQAELRRQAALALRELRDARAEGRLLWMLDDGDAAVRAAALESYDALLGGALLKVAEAALRGAHEDVRVQGLGRLVKLEGKARGAEAEGLLEGAIEDEAEKVRAEAFRTLWAWHDKDPEPVLDRALRARFPDLRLRAVAELESRAKDEKSAARPAALERLGKTIADRDVAVGTAAYEASVRLRGKKDPEPHLAALGSTHGALREKGARGAEQVGAEGAARVADALKKQLADENEGARTAALEALDKLLPGEAGYFQTALAGAHLDLRVRAAELIAARREERSYDGAMEAMRALIADEDLKHRYAAPVLLRWRQRAATALASLGSPRLMKYFATELLKHEDGLVREQAARGMATAARPGATDEGYLLDALGHGEVWVRSWAADGLSRLGDARALPVLTGTLRHEHLPIRLASILSLAALGPEGYGGMLQGLEDGAREVQEIVFCIVLARDLRAFRKGQPPDLLVSALSSQRPEVRFAAARALELRTEGEGYLGHVIEVLLPPRPEKAADMKDWPAEEARGRLVVGLCEALAGDSPELRYAGAMVLRLRDRPLDYFREASRLGKPRSASAAVVPDNAPRPVKEREREDGKEPAKPQRGWLRRLFSGDAAKAEGREADAPSEARSAVPEAEALGLRRLAFGAYVGLLRQVSAGDDEGHRVRRDAVDRLVELGVSGGLGVPAALPAVLRALDDPHHLVRRAAFSGLKRLFPAGSDEPLALALGSTAPDVARLALDELFARAGAEGAGRAQALDRIRAALSAPSPEVRRYAFELLERGAGKGSLEALLAALQSDYADLRIGVIERLATQRDERVTAALRKALGSDHGDLRLRAAELLAERKDDLCVDVLAALLRAEEGAAPSRARAALVRLGSPAAARALLSRADELKGDERAAMLAAIGEAREPGAMEGLCAYADDESGAVRGAAFDAALRIADRAYVDRGEGRHDVERGRDTALALRFFAAAARSKDAALRLRAAGELDLGKEAEAGALLVSLMSDRDAEVRKAAARAYGLRVAEKEADVAPMLAVLAAGTRELLLAAAEAAAHRGEGAALRPLLLLVRAGEDDERPKALLALGTLGDARALSEIETIAAGGTEEAPADPAMRAAAIEALGRIAGKLKDADARRRVIEKVEEASAGSGDLQRAAVIGLRHIGGERGRARLEALLASTAEDDDVRREAAEQLGRLGDAAAEATLGRVLSDDEYDVRWAARKALDRLFPSERVRVEFLAVESSEEDIAGPAAAYLAREADAAQLLGRIGALRDRELRRRLRHGLLRRSALPAAPLVTLSESADAAAREEAAWLAGARAPSFADSDRQRLGEALLKAEAGAAGKAALAAQQGGDEAREAEERVWLRALWAAAQLARGAALAPQVTARSRALLRSASEKAGAAPAAVRREAAATLALLGTEDKKGLGESLEALGAALRDTDAAVRQAAATALSRLGPERAAELALAARPFDATALSPVATAKGALRGAAADKAVATAEGRRLLLPRLVREGDAAPLLELARKGEGDVRLSAIDALGRIGGPAALELLRALSQDKKGEKEPLRKHAYRALRRAERRAKRPGPATTPKTVEAQP